MKKFAILVGNGFTQDLANEKGLNSGLPFKNFNSVKINYKQFIKFLPTINLELIGKDDKNFELINTFLVKYKIGSPEECMLRRFLAMSYSHLQLELDKIPIAQWKWTEFFKKNKRGLKCAISFNYDVLLERALRYSGSKPFRVGTNDNPGTVPVLKPHGSLDFDMPVSAFGDPCHDQELIWSTTTALNDMQFVCTLPKERWFCPRAEADIIPPSSGNFQRHLSWVSKMFERFKLCSKNLDAFVIVGSSYWNVDRPEIDFFLEKLPKSCVVYIANKKPEEALLETLDNLNLSYRTFSFDELPW